ncbi:MAG: hypothetical protein NZ740_09360 [Kiritimatiellae bacterium]|nr:hypothetical protein [Kiritimatiellia bacterium]MDW8459301.1 hypothetical protein [Verrucomicrobiota bacterium]
MSMPVANDQRIIVGASLAALALAMLVPGPSLPEVRLLGAFIGIVQSLIGLYCYRVAMNRKPAAVGLAIGSGALRVGALVLAAAALLSTGLPAVPFLGSLLAAYIAMMAAEVILVARWSLRTCETN